MAARSSLRRPAVLWPAALVAVLALGIWGFLDLRVAGGGPAPVRLPAVTAFYSTLRLFVVDLDLPDGTLAPPQLWLAALAAPALTLRGIAQLFREQLDGLITQRFARPEVVVFGANDRAAALIASLTRRPGTIGRWDRAVVVVDPDPRALETVTTAAVRRVRGDGTGPASLDRAAVHRARYVVIVTGDNARNAAVATAVRAAVRDRPTKPEVYAEVEEPGLARTLEQGGRLDELDVIPFSAAAMAAAAVLDQLEHERRLAGRPALLDPGGGPEEEDAGPALALFGTGDLVDAVVLELHRRRQVQLLEEPGAAAVRPRVVVFGPDAGRRRRSLATLVGTELQLLELEAFDVELDQVVELDVETARHLARSRPLRQVLVLTPTDLDGGGIAVTLARHLGRGADVALVTGSATSPFGDEIRAQSALPTASLAKVELFRVPDQAYTLAALQGERVADRLGRALWRSAGAPGTDTWADLAEDDRQRYRAEAVRQLEVVGAAAGLLRGSALVAPRPAEVPLLAALGFDQPVALARAGLGVDFESVDVLARAGRTLLDRGDPAAFDAWCELARLQTDPAGIAAVAPAGAATADQRDVQDLLRIRRATLDDPDPRPGPGPAAARIVVLGGAGDDPDLAVGLLAPALERLPPDTVADALLPAGPLHGMLARLGARVGTGPTRRQALDLWSDLVAAGHRPAGVRVLALPGAGPQEVQLARALGARLARVETADGPDLGRVLLGGGVDVVPLPADRMTVRAFLRPAHWPAALKEHRQPLAAELQRRYVARHRPVKQPGDPALELWPALTPWLRRSTLAAVDDIPTKLALVGLRLALPDEAGAGLGEAELAAALDARMELLAEQEHGRFTAERLLAGWAGGVRDPARFLSPHLLPWSELDSRAKGYDEDLVRDIPGLLAGAGLRVLPARPG